MRILYGITKSNWGGAQRYVYDMAAAARAAGHEVSVLAGGNGVLMEKLRHAGLRTISLPSVGRDISLFGDIRGFIDIFGILLDEKPDVFHINSSKMGGIGAFAARLAGVRRIIFTSHAWAWNENRSFMQKLAIKQLSWLIVMLSHETICVSEAIRRDAESLPFAKGRLVVIRHGIEDFPLLARDISRQALWPGIEDRTLLVGTIAELHKVKGLDTAIRGFSLAFKGKDVRFAIIGGGDEREGLERLIEELGMGSQIRLAGFMENAREHLSGLDIFSFTSRSEALGIALLEAGIARLPVIATSVGGIPEMIKDQQTGLLIPRDDAGALARALGKLAHDKGLRDKLGERLRMSILEDFSEKRAREETLRQYQS